MLLLLPFANKHLRLLGHLRCIIFIFFFIFHLIITVLLIAFRLPWNEHLQRTLDLMIEFAYTIATDILNRTFGQFFGW